MVERSSPKALVVVRVHECVLIINNLKSSNDVLSITNKTSFVPEDFSKNLIKKELTKIVKQKLK